MATVVIPVLLFLFLTGVSAWSWWFMTRRPAQWAAMVEKENNFWRDKGVVSQNLTDKMKRWETSALLKNLALTVTLIGFVGLLLTSTVLARVMIMEHHQLRMPFNPVLKARPNPPVKRPMPASPTTTPKRP